MKKRAFVWLFTALAVSMVGPTLSHADFINFEDFSLDTTTELNWLKLGPLVGYSYSQVSAGALGFTTSGWRYATQSEVVDLFTEYSGVQNGGYSNWSSGPNAVSSAYFDGTYDLVLKLGMNFAFNDSRATVNSLLPGLDQISVQGMFDDGLPGDSRQGFAEATTVIADASGLNCFSAIVPCGRWGATTDIIPLDATSVTRSSFLVRQVPEPGTLALLMIGLLGMNLARKRQTES